MSTARYFGRHFGLPDPAVDVHRRGWKNSGLPKLKAVDQAEDANAGHKREPAAETKVAEGERPALRRPRLLMVRISLFETLAGSKLIRAQCSIPVEVIFGAGQLGGRT